MISYLLGAGASVDAGLPTSTRLTDQILDACGPRTGTRRVLNFVIGALLHEEGRRNRSPRDGIDIERVMTALDLLAARHTLEISPFVAAWDPILDDIDKPEPSTSAGSGLRNALNNTTPFAGRQIATEVWELAHTRSHGQAFARAREECTRQLVALLNDVGDTSYLSPLFGGADGPTLVATLNYDLTVESEGQRLDASVDTGLHNWFDTGRWQWDGGASVRLLKLHGSLDWQRELDATGALRTHRTRPGDSTGHDPAIIFGGGNKLRAEGPFLELLAQWDAQLASTDDLVTVGYSFRDPHVNEILIRWINGDEQRRLVVIDPAWNPDRRASFAADLAHGLEGVPYIEPSGSRNGQEARPFRLLPLAMPAATGLPIALRALRIPDVWAAPESGSMSPADVLKSRIERVRNES